MKKKVTPIVFALTVAVFALLILVISRVLFPADQSSNTVVSEEELYKHFLLYDGYTVEGDAYDFSNASKTSDDQIAIIIQNQLVTDRAKKDEGGRIYLGIEFVRKYIDDRFYWDTNENVLVFTTATDIIKSSVGSMDYFVTKVKNTAEYVVVKAEGQDTYVALDFVKQYTGIESEYFDNPNRLCIINGWNTTSTVGNLKSGDKIRIKASEKSHILRKCESDQEVVVLSEEDKWAKVATADGYIGYIKKSKIKNTSTKTYTTAFVEPEYTSIHKDRTISMGWQMVTSENANVQLVDLVAATKGLTVVSPTWFRLSDNEGNFDSFASADYVTKAHMVGVEVWAMLDDQSQESDNRLIFPYTSKRERLINQLVATAIEYNLDGLNIDIEYIPLEMADSYIQFIRELSVKCRVNGIVLSVDTGVPDASNGYYNRKAQGKVADYVIMMGYDEHWGETSGAGSVASLPWVTQGIVDMLADIPADKVINAMPFYTRIWQENMAGQYVGSQAVDMQTAIDTLTNYGVTPAWVDNFGQNYGEYTEGDSVYRIWLEDSNSVEEKLKLIQNYGLAGVACWRLGMEYPDIWNTIIKYTNS